MPTPKPTPDEINAALAEYMGWRWVSECGWMPADAVEDTDAIADPTECLNACALVARKMGALVLFDEGIPLATVTAGAGRAANSDDEPVPLAVATALYRLLLRFPEIVDERPRR